ncbi:MAG: Gx transporter family protein [Aerococcus sp.]|nr:Gx transporter family protein [Aerococcus sp.]
MRNDTHYRLIYAAMLAAQAMVIGGIESILPSPFAIAPGAKLGIANLVTVLALFMLPARDAFAIVLLRTGGVTLMFGTFSSFIYSLTGAMLSLIAMLVVKRLGPRWVSVIGLSIVGGFMHNIGQLLIAALIAKSWYILNYLPVLTIAGIASGFFVGLVGNYLLVHMSHLYRVHFQKETVEAMNEWL